MSKKRKYKIFINDDLFGGEWYLETYNTLKDAKARKRQLIKLWHCKSKEVKIEVWEYTSPQLIKTI